MTVIEFKRRERKDRSILDGWKTYWQTKIEILRKKSFKTCLIFPSSIKHGKQSTREDLSCNKRNRYHSIDKETLTIWEWFGTVLLSKIDITTWCLWEEWHFFISIIIDYWTVKSNVTNSLIVSLQMSTSAETSFLSFLFLFSGGESKLKGINWFLCWRRFHTTN